MKLRFLFCILIICSIAVTYYVIVVNKDFEIVTNPEGPDTSDYFEEPTTTSSGEEMSL